MEKLLKGNGMKRHLEKELALCKGNEYGISNGRIFRKVGVWNSVIHTLAKCTFVEVSMLTSRRTLNSYGLALSESEGT